MMKAGEYDEGDDLNYEDMNDYEGFDARPEVG